MRNNYIDIGRLIVYLKYNWIQVFLIILSLYDLRIDIRLLFDYFTFSSLFYTISEHTLALTVLITIPRLFGSLKNNNQ